MAGRWNWWPQSFIIGRILVLTFVFAIHLSAESQISRPLVQATISRIADTAHVEFRGLKNWRYDVLRVDPKKTVISIPSIDDASVAKLQSFTDPFVKKVQVNKNGPDSTYLITFELAESDVETFEYQTDDPARLIVDFYRKTDNAENSKPKNPKDAKVETASKRPSKLARRGQSASRYQDLNHGRKPAGDELLSVKETTEPPGSDVRTHFGIFDSGDENYERFRIKDYEIHEEAILASRQNIYLPFPMLKMNVSHLDKLIEEQPEYSIRPKETRENKEARLLLALFERKRFAVFMKTYDYFQKKYPESDYREILKNLVASVHLRKWREEGKLDEYEMARSIYHELVEKFPESPLREYNYLILGYIQLDRGEALGVLQTFQAFQKDYPSSAETPQIRKALAEAYVILRRYDEATGQYNSIIQDFPKTEDAKEAKYRLGDVAFAKGDYTQAIQLYEASVKELPKEEKIFPNADFNAAEARFSQKDYRKSLNGFIRFVTLFPTHEFGGYALTRVGELLGILGADPTRVMGAFLESYFRFPNHPGAKVARIRMLSQQMKGMKPTEEKRALEEIEQYTQSVDLPGIKEFTNLMKADGLTNRGEYTAALNTLIAYYQKNPTSNNLDTFKARILRNLSNEIEDRVKKGHFMQALQFYSEYSKTWLKNSDRIDIPYFIAGAYEKAGAYREAEDIFRQTLEKRIKIVGTVSEKEKSVQEHLPKVSSLHLRLASVLAEDRNYLEAFQQLKAIGKGEDLSPSEVIERVQLSALIAEQRNEPARAREALVQLSKDWQGDPSLVAPVNLQLAQTYLKLGDPKQAEFYADRVLKADEGETQLPDKILADAYSAKGEAEVALKKPMAAVETYQKLLERYESKMPLASVRYKVGQILYERGDFKGANDVWQRLQGTSGDFLWKVGREKLEDTKWRGDYNKYISRIPAMSARKEDKP